MPPSSSPAITRSSWARSRPTTTAIKLAGEVNDFATREILEHILQDEDAHIDRIEELQDQIGHMTLPLFLTTQTK